MASFNMRAWYKGAVAAGVALLAAAAVAREPGLMLVALGLILLGLGEWISHPFLTAVEFDDLGRPVGIMSGEPRRPKPFGLFIAGLGLVMLLAGAASFGVAAFQRDHQRDHEAAAEEPGQGADPGKRASGQ